MASYYSNILIDPRTSCTTNEAVAILLGRRSFDPIYKDLNPDADPEEVHASFMQWLDISIFEQLMDERDSAVTELADALEDEPRSQVKIDGCKSTVLACDSVIRQAKRVLCDIDDELAKGADSRLRIDKDATAKYQTTYITLSSLRQWPFKFDDEQKSQLNESANHPAPPANAALPRAPLLDKKGGITPASAKSFLATFGVLLEAFLERAGPVFKSEGGSDVQLQAVADFLSKRSLPFARVGHYLDKQSISSVEERIKAVKKAESIEVPKELVLEIAETSMAALAKARNKSSKPKK